LYERNGCPIIAENNVHRWKLVKAAFYFGQRDVFSQLGVDLTQRLGDVFWAHLTGDIRRGHNLHLENELTDEERTILGKSTHKPSTSPNHQLLPPLPGNSYGG
jgi:hypothetical protein